MYEYKEMAKYYDIFYSNKLTLEKLYDIAKSENIKIEKEQRLETKYRFKNEELSHLEENIYAVPYKKYEKDRANRQIISS